MQWLKQSTTATIAIGPFIDKTDGVTPETGLAVGTVDEIGVYKSDGTALVDLSGTTTFTHRAGGIYTMTLSTSDTGTLGRLRAYVRDDSVCLPAWDSFMVMPASSYDSLVGGTAEVTVSAPSSAVTDGTIIEVLQGESKTVTVVAPASDWGDLTGYTGKLGITKLTSNGGTSTLERSASVANANTETQGYTFTWTTAQTAAWALDTATTHPYRTTANYAYRYTIGATDGGGNCPSFAQGFVTVKARDITC